MKNTIISLREVMKERALDAWLSPSSDAHGSEYVSKHDECRKYLSGFTGSAGILLVLKEKAFLWTDGRYFVQAEKELKDSGIELMRMGDKKVSSVDDYITKNMKPGEQLGFYAPLIDAVRGMDITKKLEKKGVRVITNQDITNDIWVDRPKRSCESIIVHDIKFSGYDINKKLELVRKEIKKAGCDMLVDASLDDIAWVMNLRGSDIECNPLFLSYSIITENDCILFVQKNALTLEAKKQLIYNNIKVLDYDSWSDYICDIKDFNINMDMCKSNFEIYSILNKSNVITDRLSPIELLKCVKNNTEIAHMKSSHIRDGIYITKFMYWLKNNIQRDIKITEIDASKYLDNLRLADTNCIMLSFPTISAYGDNAAMCHYEAEEESAAVLKSRGLYLVDSGGHYLDGTTDITRTIALGTLTQEERFHYTLTVIGMLRLMNAKFPRGTRGYNLDILARGELWRYGLDFNHGTGHGVGFCNTVHEGPIVIRTRPSSNPKLDIILEPGMVISDEPGYYEEGKHGIRTENLLLCVENKLKSEFLEFESLTIAPIDSDALDKSIMTKEDLLYYTKYQNIVYEKLHADLTRDEAEWLKIITQI